MKAGIGDLLSNASAVVELRELSRQSRPINDFALLVSETALVRFTARFQEIQSDDLELSKELAKGLVLSGMAMGFSGDSSPCSGSEHLISHSIDKYLGGRALHGEQVGLATIFINELRKLQGREQLPSSLVRILRDYCGFITPEKFGIQREEFIKCALLSDTVRPGRVPFWKDSISSSETLHKAYELSFTS
ncbi:Iron-containing alcohol dehydrogenase [compost metagenome]